jgi:hypothetical protein
MRTLREWLVATFLLWNVGKKNLDLLVQAIVREHSVDIVLLVEYYPSLTTSNLDTLLIADGLTKRNNSQRFGIFARSAHGLASVPVTSVGDRAELWDWRSTTPVDGRVHAGSWIGPYQE